MSLPPGARLGPYEILAPIGAGGMGEVYRARDARLGRDVAIKVLLPASFSADPDRLRRFEQEARAAGILNHPNITPVYDRTSVRSHRARLRHSPLPSARAFVDTFRIYYSAEGSMVMRARLFKSGGSQAVRLPKPYRFEGQKEVLIYRQGGKVVLEGRRDEWSREFLALAGAAPDFPYTRRRRKAEPGPDLD